MGFNWAITFQKQRKSICCTAKGEGAVDHCTLTKCLKKFHFHCKNLDDQTTRDRLKAVDSKAVLQAVDANPASKDLKSIRQV